MTRTPIKGFTIFLTATFVWCAWADKTHREALVKGASNAGLIAKEKPGEEMGEAEQKLYVAFSPGSRLDFLQRLMLLADSVPLVSAAQAIPVSKICEFWKDIDNDSSFKYSNDWLWFKQEHGLMVDHLLFEGEAQKTNVTLTSPPKSCGQGILKEIRIQEIDAKTHAKKVQFILRKNLDLKNPNLDIHYHIKDPLKVGCDSNFPMGTNCVAFQVYIDSDSRHSSDVIAGFKALKDQVSRVPGVGAVPKSNYKDFSKDSGTDPVRDSNAARAKMNEVLAKARAEQAELLNRQSSGPNNSKMGTDAELKAAFSGHVQELHQLSYQVQDLAGTKILNLAEKNGIQSLQTLNIQVHPGDPQLLLSQGIANPVYHEFSILRSQDAFLAVARVSHWYTGDNYFGMGGNH